MKVPQERWLRNKTIKEVRWRKFSDGRGGTTCDPLLIFTDGSEISFSVRETESDYGVDPVYTPPAQTRPRLSQTSARKTPLRLLEYLMLEWEHQTVPITVLRGQGTYGEEPVVEELWEIGEVEDGHLLEGPLQRFQITVAQVNK